MKKWIRMTALALAALLALAGCGKKQEQTGDRLAQIQQKGELVIALEGNWAPWSTMTATLWWATMWKWARPLPRSWA